MKRHSSVIVTAVASALVGFVSASFFERGAQAPVAETTPSPSTTATAPAPTRFELQRPTLSGQVVDEHGQPVDGAVVVALALEGELVYTSSHAPLIDPGEEGVLSDAGGRFTIMGLPPGRYVLVAIHGHHSPGRSGPVVVTSDGLSVSVEVKLGSETIEA